MQAIFDSFGIRYTDTGYIGSLLAMDKDISKKLMVANHILTPDWILLDRKDSDDYQKGMDEVKFPCVAKPCSCSSSIGVTIVNNTLELDASVKWTQKYENTLLIEKKIEGRESSVGILDHNALPVIEIILKSGFYDYKNKYQKGLTAEICPAQISADLTEKVQKTALEVHQILRLGFYFRIDFILDANQDFYCLEANTLPGMTPTSLLPQEANVAGISYSELCEKIAGAAL